MASLYERSTRKVSKVLVRFPFLVLLGVLGITAVSISHVLRLFKNVQTDFKSLLPEDQPSVVRLEAISDRFGTPKNLILVFETENKEAILNMLPLLADEIRKLPDVEKVRYQKPGYDFFNKRKLLFPSVEDLKDFKNRLDRRIQQKKLSGLFI